MSRVAASRRARTPGEDEEEDEGEEGKDVYSGRAKGSGTTARGRRLLKVRDEKRKREYDRLHSYPTWAKSVFLYRFLIALLYLAFSSLYDMISSPRC